MEIQIYNYDAQTKEYTYSGIAQESPLEPGIYLLPPNATELAPPKTKENEVAIFDEKKQKWNIVIDNRGMNCYNILGGSPSIVE